MLTQAIEDDTAQQIASWMIADPEVWLALLARPEEPTRRLAAAQLAKLLGQPISFDPAADAARSKRQIDSCGPKPWPGRGSKPVPRKNGKRGNRDAESRNRKPE